MRKLLWFCVVAAAALGSPAASHAQSPYPRPAVAESDAHLPDPTAEAAALLLIRFRPAVLDDTDFWTQLVSHLACAEAEQFLGGEFDAPRNPADFRGAFRNELSARVARTLTVFALHATGSLGTYDFAAQRFPVSSPLKGEILMRHSLPSTGNPYRSPVIIDRPPQAGTLIWPLGRIEKSSCSRGQAVTRNTPAATARGRAWPTAPAGERWYRIEMDRDVSDIGVSKTPDLARDFAARAGRNLDVTLVFEVSGVKAIDGQVVTLIGHVRDYRLVSPITREVVTESRF